MPWSADALVAGVVLAIGALGLLPRVLLARLRALLPVKRSWRILYLGTGQITQVSPRNGAGLFLQRECSDFDGLFEQLWNVHFPAGSRGALDLTPRHHLVDFDVSIPRWLQPLRLTATAVREVAFLWWIVPFASKHGISVVTATNPYLQGLNAALLARMLNLPYGLIVTRDYDWDWEALGKQAFPTAFPSRAVEKRIEGWVYPGAALVLADRQYYRDYAVRNGADPTRAVATRVLVDEAYQRARPNPALRERLGLAGGPLMIYVGRLEQDKVAMDLIPCLARVRASFPSAQLACAGTGSLGEAMWAEADRRGVSAGLHLLGNLPLEELADLVATSDVVVATHMGYTLIEAALTGVPIVTYDYDWHAEIIENGVTGFLVPFRDCLALADAVCNVLRDRALAEQVGTRLRDSVRKEHTLAAVVPLYQEAYRRVLSRQGRHTGRVPHG